MPKPELYFFCELEDEALSELFDARFVIDDLRDLDASLSLGILSLSETRAKIVQRLNLAGVPVVAWLLLPEDEGYWFNIENYDQAAARYLAFKAWTTQYKLKWAGIGLDIEPDINEMRLLNRKDAASRQIFKMIKRFSNKIQVIKAQRAYQALVDLIHADGYPVESYQLPLIVEERKARATVLQRIMGLVDIDTDREVLMLYSSFIRPHGPAVLLNYAPDSDSIGIGSTGGGVDIEGVIDNPPLTWEEFSRDLRYCIMQGKPVHVFSLEGCVKQGFLSKLNTFDWDMPVKIIPRTTGVSAGRTTLAAFLWLLERPWVLIIAIASLVGLGFLFKQSKK